jgi:hypothetical protein
MVFRLTAAAGGLALLLASTSLAQSNDRADRRAAALERQAGMLAHMRELGAAALRAAEARKTPEGPPRDVFVNNEMGDDAANGLAASAQNSNGPVRTFAKAVSLLRPGDTLHLAVTNAPYHETLKLPDNFGGMPGRPTIVDGHGATITGSDPLRLDGWTETTTPGLYKSEKLLAELEEFTDEAKLDRVFFVFDGVAQHMGRSSKGVKARFKSPATLQAREWTYVEAEKAFYVKVEGKLEDAKVEVPYRRNGVAVRAPKAALSHVVVKNLVVCRVLNDGFNIHGTTQDLLFQNIASYECGDDGISPHDTCEITIDGYWAVGNSTGMANGNLAITHARNMHMEGNLGEQFMSTHAPTTDIQDSVIIATSATTPINITNSNDTRFTLENVLVVCPPKQKILIVPNTQFDAHRATFIGASWENAGKVHATQSIIAGGPIACSNGGSWEGSGNVFGEATKPPAGDTGSTQQAVDPLAVCNMPMGQVGANPAQFKIPPMPQPHPAAGTFTTLAKIGR